jgi:beta-lactamase superfamily II metal-dependent hydrolase
MVAKRKPRADRVAKSVKSNVGKKKPAPKKMPREKLTFPPKKAGPSKGGPSNSPANSRPTAGQEPLPSPESSEGEATRGVKICMYNTGFGDCFLLTIPTPDRPRKILIDCGKHNLSKCEPPLDRIVAEVLKDIDESGKKRIDLLVITHRHLDHVSGFGIKKRIPEWDKVEVGEVWMPWTEDPSDPVARRICERQSQRALRLKEIVPKLGLGAAQRDYLLGYAGNNMTNEDAMKLLHNGFTGSPPRHFLPVSDDKREARTVDALPGVNFYILGPSRSEKVIRDMDPPEGEAYLRAASAALIGEQARPSPFAAHWIMNRKEYRQWFRKTLAKKAAYDPLESFSEEMQAGFSNLLDSPEAELAAALEKSVNGTSLVLLIRIGTLVLLFPGDAQWGTWNEILENEAWRQMLKSVDFYKVGHHGSHNATPRRFIEELLPASARAMIPTDNVTTWPLIPKKQLLQALTKKNVGFVRSDRELPGDPPAFVRHAENGYTLKVELTL